jgi:hypothetical protein
MRLFQEWILAAIAVKLPVSSREVGPCVLSAIPVRLGRRRDDRLPWSGRLSLLLDESGMKPLGCGRGAADGAEPVWREGLPAWIVGFLGFLSVSISSYRRLLRQRKKPYRITLRYAKPGGAHDAEEAQ